MSFTFRRFAVSDDRCGMKVGTDSVILGAWTDASHCRTAIDVGAGCGLLSLMLAQRFAELSITAIEIDPGAAADCLSNVVASPFANRINVINDDIFSVDIPRVDLIICNPPFFTETLHSPDKNRAEARHEGNLGIDSLIKFSLGHLNEGGTLAFVAPSQRDSEIDLSLAIAGFAEGRLLHMRQRDTRPIVRSFRQLSIRQGIIKSDTLTVNNHDGSRSHEYACLTSDFYL